MGHFWGSLRRKYRSLVELNEDICNVEERKKNPNKTCEFNLNSLQVITENLFNTCEKKTKINLGDKQPEIG